jgi:hypothetical protein
MSSYNPIASMQRLEAAGFKRAQAEALAEELRAATGDLVTRDILKAELDRLLIRQSAACAALLALAVTLSKIFA